MIDESVKTALEAAKENLQRLSDSPIIVDVQGDEYEDFVGEASLRIDVLFDDATTDAQIASAPILDIKDVVMRSLTSHGVRLFPYFFFARANEVEAAPQDG